MEKPEVTYNESLVYETANNLTECIRRGLFEEMLTYMNTEYREELFDCVFDAVANGEDLQT